MEAAINTLALTDLLAQQDWMQRLARSLVQDASAADDLVQSTWLAAARRPPAADRRVRPWLARVMRNLASERVRTDRRRAARERERFAHDAAAPSDQVAQDAETRALVSKLVLALEEPHRSTILLRYYAGLTSAEIARREGLPAATVRARVQRGLELLRLELDAGHDGDRRAWVALLLPLARKEETVAGISAGALAILAVSLVGAVAASVFFFKRGSQASSDEADVVMASEASAPAEELPGTATDSPGRSRERAEESPAEDRPAASEAEETPATYKAWIEGRVVDSEGRPLGGAELHMFNNAALKVPVGRSGFDGRFRWEVAIGMHTDDFPMRFDVLHARGVRRQIFIPAVLNGDTAPAGDIVLAPGGRIHGRVLDEAGRGLEGAEVFLHAPQAIDDETARIHGPGTYQGVHSTDEEGYFDLAGSPVGAWVCWSGGVGRQFDWSEEIELHEGDELEVALVLRPLPARNRISLRVVDASGAPFANQWVQLDLKAPRVHSTLDRWTDEEGRLVERWSDDAPVKATVFPDLDSGHDRVAIEGVHPGVETEVRLRALRQVTLEVLDENGVELTEYTGSLKRLGAPSSFGLDQDFVRNSHFSPEPPLVFLPSSFEIEVNPVGGVSSTLGPYYAEEIDDPLILRIEPLSFERPIGLRGTVTAGQHPVEGATVHLWSYRTAGFSSTWEHTSTTTDTHGLFAETVEGVAPTTIEVRSDGFPPHMLRLGELENAPEELEIELQRAGSAGGNLRTSSGKPAMGRYIVATHPGARPVSAVTDSEGGFELVDLRPGSWTVSVYEASFEENRAPPEPVMVEECTVLEDRRNALELTWPDPAIARGTLRIDGQLPVGWGIDCRLIDESPLGVSEVGARVDEVGGFEFEVLGMGTRVVRLSGPISADEQVLQLTWMWSPDPGETVHRDFDLRLGRVEGRLLRPLDDEEYVMAYGSSPELAISWGPIRFSTDQEGNFTFFAPERPARIVRSWPSERTPEQLPFEVVAGGVATLRVP